MAGLKVESGLERMSNTCSVILLKRLVARLSYEILYSQK